MTTIDRKRFAKAIKDYRKEHDLTLQEFASKVPTTLNTVYRWESGRSAPKDQLTLDRLRGMGLKI